MGCEPVVPSKLRGMLSTVYLRPFPRFSLLYGITVDPERIFWGLDENLSSIPVADTTTSRFFFFFHKIGKVKIDNERYPFLTNTKETDRASSM